MSRQDNRRYTRVPFEADIQLDHDGRRLQAELIDISLKGILVLAPGDFAGKPGDPCLATLELGEEAGIEMECTVIHVSGNHVGRRTGLRIDRLDMDSIAHLRRLLELNLGDPELLDRELSGLHD